MPKAQPALVECHNLSKSFGTKPILQNINLTIPHGKIVGLLGKNGAGKSTLLKLLNGLLVPSNGKILINERPIGSESKRIVSYLPERTYLDRHATVRGILKFFSEFYDNFDSKKAQHLLKKLDLDETMHVSTMSKGMQEKLQLVLVMSRRAELYILDEPLGGVDPATRDYILDTILSNFEENASLLISTHLISDVERILDEVIFIDDGKITLTANADKLRNKHKTSIDAIFREQFKH